MKFKGVIPFQNLSILKNADGDPDTDRTWDKPAAEKRVRTWAGAEDAPNAKYKKAFLWFDSENPDNFGSYKLLIGDIVDGSLKAIPRGIFAVAAVLQGARGGVDIPQADQDRIKNIVSRYYEKMDMIAPWDRSIDEGEVKLTSLDGKKCYVKKAIKYFPNVSGLEVKVLSGAQIENLSNIEINFDVSADQNYTVIEGYANNKLIPGTDTPAQDSYGDIPTGDNVYDFERVKTNPVMLAGHDNEPFKIMGNFIFLKENKQGLKFRAVLRPLDEVFHPETKDAISAFAKGFGKAMSIGGMWYYDFDLSNIAEGFWILIKAIIHEISGVGVGADPHALVGTPDPKDLKRLEDEVEKFMETGDDKLLEKIADIIK